MGKNILSANSGLENVWARMAILTSCLFGIFIGLLRYRADLNPVCGSSRQPLYPLIPITGSHAPNILDRGMCARWEFLILAVWVLWMSIFMLYISIVYIPQSKCRCMDPQPGLLPVMICIAALGWAGMHLFGE